MPKFQVWDDSLLLKGSEFPHRASLHFGQLKDIKELTHSAQISRIGHHVSFRDANPFLAFSKNRRHLVSYVPRAVRQKSPIRDLRGIINKSQCEFARSLGISPSALKRIENNDLALSRRVAHKIELEAGIDRRALLRGRLRTIEGQQYRAPFYQAWKENYSWQSEDVAKAIASRLEPLLVAAALASKRRMWQVLGEIFETLDRCRTGFNLQRPIDAFLAEQRPPIKWDDLMKPRLEWKASKPTAEKSKRPLTKRRRR